MRATPVRTRADFRDFCEFPARLHPRDKYVPLPAPVIAGHRRTATLYVVRDHRGRVVGRTSTHRDAAFGAGQLFGHTEFTDDDAVFTALMDVVSRAAGGRSLFGPVALLPNQTGGVITSGFGRRGFVDSAWNPAYYPAMYERHGFTRRFEADTWAVEVAGSADAYKFDDSRLAAERLVIRHGSRRGLRHQLPILRKMLNASFAQLGYYTEISAEQLAEQTDGLAYLLDEGLLVWLEKAGRPVAFIVAMPDVSEFLMSTGGRLGPIEQLRLLATRSRYRRDAVLVVKGVVPGEQGQGYMTLLSREVHRHLEANGYRTLRSTFVERDNAASTASYRRAGGRALHGYTFYQRGAA
ncbi:GNAT family N-acetyltransferase [Actinoplanes sp. TRM 88003]|uniref:GNAT family N-acetyltransferase n=1 Tax=Paractinoplanes aksuensis TaxID=2939490 RepID=A0ABT1DSC3_9ACTN|nr:GNAT family N-acetyltransferase [Actinoplanes aksuensis]MCO8273744.1 GNAT family N-acetyltransferase [Actinoplanes aksuensis]